MANFFIDRPIFCLGAGNPVVSDRDPGDFFIAR